MSGVTKAIVEPLLQWYDEGHRDLPWRREPVPYRVWVSEIMLQQTRVEAVRGYYERWMQAFPDVRALAAADEAQVLKLWEGLGYYSRARNLHRAAQLVCERYGGTLPADYEALLALPGVGEYTADAVASIGFGLCVPAVDGNVMRVAARLNDDFTPITDAKQKKRTTGHFSEITPEDTVLIIGAGPTGVCTLACVLLKQPKRVIVCEKDPTRIALVREHYPDVLLCQPEACEDFVRAHSDHGGADVVLEVAGAKDTFELAWRCARPNAIVTVVALYDEAQTLPLPDMYGKNLIFKTGGVDGCDCAEILRLIAQGKIDTTPLITHRFPLSEIEEAYRIFENRLDGVIKVAITAE